jgi:hypothetical protein
MKNYLIFLLKKFNQYWIGFVDNISSKFFYRYLIFRIGLIDPMKMILLYMPYLHSYEIFFPLNLNDKYPKKVISMHMILFYGSIEQMNICSLIFFIFRSIHKSNMENLILFCGNNAQGDERIMNILEIVVLMLREQVKQRISYS